MKHWILIAGLTFLALPACGSDDDSSGSGGSSGTGATGGGGTGGSAGSSTGGASGGGGTTNTGGASGGGGTTNTGGAAGGGGTSTGGTAGAGATDGGADCNTLVNDGSDIPETQESGTPPTMTGGTIPDGTYVLTARKDWDGTCNCTTRQKIVVKNGGTTVETVRREDSGADQHLSGTFTTSGTDLTITITCPTGVGALQKKYTVTSTNPVQLQIYDETDKSIDILTKQ